MTVYKCGRLSVLKEPAVFAGLNPFPRILQLLKCPVMSPGIYTGNVRMYACSMSVCLKSWLSDDPGRSISNSPAIRKNSWQSRKTPERLRKTGLTSASRLKRKLWQCLRKFCAEKGGRISPLLPWRKWRSMWVPMGLSKTVSAAPLFCALYTKMTESSCGSAMTAFPSARRKDRSCPAKNVGIRMICRITDEIEYRNLPGLNVLTVRTSSASENRIPSESKKCPLNSAHGFL